jgi:hypothetical protein
LENCRDGAHGLTGSADSLAKDVIACQGKMADVMGFLWRELSARGKPIAACDDASCVVAARISRIGKYRPAI